MPKDVRAESRRQFLRFLAESPLLCAMGGAFAATTAFAQEDAALSGAYDFKGLIKSADDALNVWDFEAVARARLDPGHLAYLAQGSDDLAPSLPTAPVSRRSASGRGAWPTSATPTCRWISSANA